MVSMTLFAGRARTATVRALRHDLRLLLPADPGRDQMLEYIRDLYDPRARLASLGRINIDNMREVFLLRPEVIEPGVAAEAGVPGEMTVAYFSTIVDRSGITTKTERYLLAANLMHGLAIRLGGIAWPQTPEMKEPLRATVYTPREISARDVHDIASRFAPGLTAYDNPTFGPYGVSFWRTNEQLELSHWPKGTVHALQPHSPISIGDLHYHSDQATAIRLKLSTPADQTDPGTARLLGECGLEVAAAAGGPCVDQIGFRVTRPEDLVFPPRDSYPDKPA